MEIVLYLPQIPPNTGRSPGCAPATDTRVNLIEPLGFSLDDKYLKRAGLDYWPARAPRVLALVGGVPGEGGDRAAGAVERAAGGGLSGVFGFAAGEVIVLGTETMGLPATVLDAHEHHVRIPIWGKVRSLNLSCAAVGAALLGPAPDRGAGGARPRGSAIWPGRAG
jgi:tRNA (cytidine/uridine-2'-O-)-methyltransferase